MGISVPLNDHPGYDTPAPLPYYKKILPSIQKALGDPPWKGLWAANWSQKKCVTQWKEKALSKPFTDGMDFWWIDGWAEDPFPGIKGQMWVNRHYYEVAEKETGKRGMILSRWGGWGSHRYPIQFSGDTLSDWDTLKYQIMYTARSGDAGAIYWSHDIGGFYGKTIADDLYIRWIQFGAFSPVFRTHSAFGTREPFAYSAKAKAVFRKVVNWRYAMIPYYYHLAREAHETGMGICRPMYLHYPDPRSAYAFQYQYLIGRDVLVAPAFSGNQTCERDVWFPIGRWIRPETGRVIQVNGVRKINIPLEEIPVYYRGGSIIPHQAPQLSSRDQKPDQLYLDIYPEIDNPAELDLYEDDGESLAYQSGGFSRTRIRCTRNDTKIVIKAEKPRGRYQGMPEKREIIFNVWLAQGERVDSIMIDGQKISDGAFKISQEYAAGAVKGTSWFVRIKATAGTAALDVIILLK